MSKRRKADEPSLRDVLGEELLTAFKDDWSVNGKDAIRRMAEKYPERYVELGARLTAAVEQTSSLQDFSKCETAEDIARQLLKQVGLDERAATPAMLQAAADANTDFIARLESIAMGN